MPIKSKVCARSNSKIGIQERESVVMTTYATQAGPKKHIFHPQWSLISTNKISKFTQLTIMCLCGCFFKQSWADLWTQPEIVGVDFRTRTEIGTPTLKVNINASAILPCRLFSNRHRLRHIKTRQGCRVVVHASQPPKGDE